MSVSCPACQNRDSHSFFELKDIPVNIGVQWPSTEAALTCKRGDLHLEFCNRCSFIWNSAFDASRLEYSQHYDNSLDFSPTFQDYAQKLAYRLIESYDIRDKDVVELGCGKGHFLSLLCEEGENRGIGFDPSYEGERVNSAAAKRINYVQDFYGEAHTDHQGDLICCRHVLEHIPKPFNFLSMVRRTIGDRHSALVYFEVPNVRFILEKHSVWDIIYEHCNYFSSESLAALFRRCGFELLRLTDAYDGQFLSLDARLDSAATGESRTQDVSSLRAAVDRFAEDVRMRSQKWMTLLDQWQRENRRTVIWGGGAKAVSFLNMLKIDNAIQYVVDINPHKQGLHMPGTGQRIISPEFLNEFQPQVVVLMNPIYRGEIQTQLQELGVTAEIREA